MEEINVKEAAAILPGGAVSEQHIRKLCQDGRIKAKKVGRDWRVDKASVLAYRPEKRTRARRGKVRI